MSQVAQVKNAEICIGYAFEEKMLLEQALTHPSASTKHYERLEFLGDALLSAYIATQLYMNFPGAREGELTKAKSSIVSGASLSKIAKSLGLSECLIFSEHTKEQNSRVIERVLEDTLEAIIGAIYCDGGLKPMASFIQRAFGDRLFQLNNISLSPKSALQEYVQEKSGVTPVYTLLKQSGKAHAPEFLVQVSAGKFGEARAWGRTKKEAESKAANELMTTLDNVK